MTFYQQTPVFWAIDEALEKARIIATSMSETEHPHLSKAPIVEAMIGIDTNSINQSSLKKIEELNEALRDEFPAVEQLDEEVETETGSIKRVFGFRLIHREQRYAFSVTLDGLTFSRFAPYDTWEDLTDNAERIWNHYLSCYLPLAVRGFTIRYINDLTIPAETELKTYLKTFIEVPQDFVTNAVSNMFFRVEMPIEADACLLTLQEVLQPKTPEEASLILDYELEYSALGLKPDQLWSTIRSKRKQKNQVFWGCITKEMENKLR